MNDERMQMRPLSREEVDLAIDWAAKEGWNPGLCDAEAFWNTDPKGFVGVEIEGSLVATGSIVSYGTDYGFMGLFIVKDSWRGQGIGSRFWTYRRDMLKSRLSSDGAIGMDGVFEMQAWYAKGGFGFSHRNLRFEGRGEKGERGSALVELSEVPFEEICRYDSGCFGCRRSRFLQNWLGMPNAISLGYVSEDRLLGYGVIRKCREGFKIGPLFADNPEVGESLFNGLQHHASGEVHYLDVPEPNLEAMKLVERHGMNEVFGCARMYFGTPRETLGSKVFGITTFELG